jgi:hypothetical protein
MIEERKNGGDSGDRLLRFSTFRVLQCNLEMEKDTEPKSMHVVLGL